MECITLYIATHNKTGLKYFGKTTRYLSESELQENYHGSGKYWLNHLKEHGDDVTMKIYGIFDNDKVEKVALKFSEENNIVESKEWANLRFENGLDGGSSWRKGKTFEELYGVEKANELKLAKTKPRSESTKKKISKTLKNGNNFMRGRTGELHHSFGKTRSAEICKKMSEALKGIPKSEEHKNKLRKPKQKITCPHCSLTGGSSQMKRWHFDNCKYK